MNPAMPLRNDVEPDLLPEDVRLLTELGFCAIGGARTKEARLIFAGLMRMRPQRSFPYVGMAMAHIAAHQASEAIDVLGSVTLDDAAERADIDAFRGLALQLAGRQGESRQVLERAAQGPQGSDGVNLARRMLGYPAAGSGPADGLASARRRT